MNFQVHALPAAPFAPLFELSDAELAARHIIRKSVTEHPGYPCRISLKEADVGETVLLLNHTHLPEGTPYQGSHAIYVRMDVAQAKPQPGKVPDVLTRRLISMRLFDAQHLMIDADVMAGVDVGAALENAFDDPSVAYVHLHNAKQGCFAAKVTRVENV